MDKLVNRNIVSFTDMNDQGSPRTYQIGDIEARRSGDTQLDGIVLQLFGGIAGATMFYRDGLARLIITSNFSAITGLEEYDVDRDEADPGR